MCGVANMFFSYSKKTHLYFILINVVISLDVSLLLLLLLFFFFFFFFFLLLLLLLLLLLVLF